MTTAAATPAPQINDLIGWTKKNNRAARFLEQFFDMSAKQRAIFIFEVLTTTRAHSRKSFVCLFMKTIRAKQAKVQSTNFIQLDCFLMFLLLNDERKTRKNWTKLLLKDIYSKL